MNRRQSLLASLRWRAFAAFAEGWFDLPISDDDGHTTAELADSEQRLGQPLPAALAEWFELVGRRLRAVQDSPRLLAQLAVVDGKTPIWIENQGVWTICAALNGDADPLCTIDDADYASPNAPLSQTLLGMLVSDTLVGAWGGRRQGPLGLLGASVRGGYLDDCSDEQLQQLRSAYPALRGPGNPFYDEPVRGDATTIMRISATGLEWMTATDDAFAAFGQMFELAPPGGEHELVVAFEGLPPSLVERLTVEHGVPDASLIEPALGDVGRIHTMVGGRQQRFHIKTMDPQQATVLILAALPADFLPYVVIATHPIAISYYEVLYPAGRAAFVLPA